MPDMMMTVKGYFALAQDFEEEAAAIKANAAVNGGSYIQEFAACKAAAMRCRNSAYKLLGTSTVTNDQRHMGEVMADF
jgi:hypothetical protein